MKKILLILTLLSTVVFAKTPKTHYYFEKDYQKVWCNKNYGQTEVILYDKARVDCVTKTHAIEFDFAKKWSESIGQALYYAKILNKTPGIVLIIENKTKEQIYVNRLKKAVENQGINLWYMYPNDMKNNI